VTEAKTRLNAIETEAKTIARISMQGRARTVSAGVEQIKASIASYETHLAPTRAMIWTGRLDPAPRTLGEMQISGSRCCSA